MIPSFLAKKSCFDNKSLKNVGNLPEKWRIADVFRSNWLELLGRIGLIFASRELEHAFSRVFIS